jgi:hypothetical protein
MTSAPFLLISSWVCAMTAAAQQRMTASFMVFGAAVVVSTVPRWLWEIDDLDRHLAKRSACLFMACTLLRRKRQAGKKRQSPDSEEARPATRWDGQLQAGRGTRGGHGHRGGNGHETAGGGGTGEPIKLQGFAGSHTRPARPPEAKLRRTAGGLHFFGGELRWGGAACPHRWSLKSVLDALRVPAARPRTRHFRAEHVAGKARSGGHRGASYPLKLQGPRG